MDHQHTTAKGGTQYNDRQAAKPHLNGRWEEAQRLCQMGNALAAQGDIDQAIRKYERAISHWSEHAETQNNLGNVRALKGQTEQAVAHYERALAIRPDYAEAHFNLGLVRFLQGQTEQAVAHYERALAIRPDYAEAHCNLGNALAVQGRNDQAILHLERALSLRPNYAAAHNNLGNVMKLQGETDQAVAHYERAVSLLPDYAEAHYNLGNALRVQGQTDRAVAHFERVLSVRPDHAEAHNNLGNLLAVQGRPGQAIVHFERALSLRPDYAEAYSNLLFALNYEPNRDLAVVYDAHLDFARRWEAPLATRVETPLRERHSERRLRIGYVSSDFRAHSVGYFVEPVLKHHDHKQFEIFCYSNHPQEDQVTERLKSQVDHWLSLVGRSDDQAAQQVRADQIDILVDLNGHTANNRLLLFARKPAPVQVTWLGYPNTTGLSAMDYRITDGFSDPVGATDHLYSEKLVRLPECFSCYQPPLDTPEISEFPARKKGYVTFGCFNNMAKITPEVMAVWARLLHAIPGSHLTLKNLALSDDSVRKRVSQAFTEAGIKPERLELIGRDRSSRVHLERYWNIDIGLDPFPYNGTTTTCEALWMGVPVVTLAGTTHAGRVGLSQMSNLGLTELVAHTEEEYISIAQRLAADCERAAALRAELRSRMAASPLTDGQRFTKSLEQAYRTMWKDWWCRTP